MFSFFPSAEKNTQVNQKQERQNTGKDAMTGLWEGSRVLRKNLTFGVKMVPRLESLFCSLTDLGQMTFGTLGHVSCQ